MELAIEARLGAEKEYPEELGLRAESGYSKKENLIELRMEESELRKSNFEEVLSRVRCLSPVACRLSLVARYLSFVAHWCLSLVAGRLSFQSLSLVACCLSLVFPLKICQEEKELRVTGWRELLMRSGKMRLSKSAQSAYRWLMCQRQKAGLHQRGKRSCP